MRGWCRTLVPWGCYSCASAGTSTSALACFQAMKADMRGWWFQGSFKYPRKKEEKVEELDTTYTRLKYYPALPLVHANHANPDCISSISKCFPYLARRGKAALRLPFPAKLDTLSVPSHLVLNPSSPTIPLLHSGQHLDRVCVLTITWGRVFRHYWSKYLQKFRGQPDARIPQVSHNFLFSVRCLCMFA